MCKSLTTRRLCSVMPLCWGRLSSGGEGKNATNIHLVAWPGALSLAERLWSARELNDVGAATPRVMAQMQRLRSRGVPVRPPGSTEDW